MSPMGSHDPDVSVPSSPLQELLTDKGEQELWDQVMDRIRLKKGRYTDLFDTVYAGQVGGRGDFFKNS